MIFSVLKSPALHNQNGQITEEKKKKKKRAEKYIIITYCVDTSVPGEGGMGEGGGGGIT